MASRRQDRGHRRERRALHGGRGRRQRTRAAVLPSGADQRFVPVVDVPRGRGNQLVACAPGRGTEGAGAADENAAVESDRGLRRLLQRIRGAAGLASFSDRAVGGRTWWASRSPVSSPRPCAGPALPSARSSRSPGAGSSICSALERAFTRCAVRWRWERPGVAGGLFVVVSAATNRVRASLFAVAITFIVMDWVFVVRVLPDFERLLFSDSRRRCLRGSRRMMR